MNFKKAHWQEKSISVEGRLCLADLPSVYAHFHRDEGVPDVATITTTESEDGAVRTTIHARWRVQEPFADVVSEAAAVADAAQ